MGVLQSTCSKKNGETSLYSSMTLPKIATVQTWGEGLKYSMWYYLNDIVFTQYMKVKLPIDDVQIQYGHWCGYSIW